MPRSAVTLGGGSDEVVDLDGGWVVPAFGEAHTHWLEPGLLDTYVAEHQRAGVLYVRDLTGVPGVRERVDGVTFAAAHQGFTSPGGHPCALFASLAEMGLVPAEWATTYGDGEALHLVTSTGDVDRVWPGFLATRPDVVKVFLPALAPEVAAHVVRRAHADGLPAAAHVETADDVHVAVTVGVDELAHLPFREPYAIRDADLRAVTVATTTEWLEETPEAVGVTRENVARLRAAGATVVVGTDLFRTTAVAEADRLHRLGLLDRKDLLRAWCVDTCREMRSPGDVVVLGGDPLEDWAHVHDVRMVVRGGVPLAPAPLTFPIAAGG